MRTKGSRIGAMIFVLLVQCFLCVSAATLDELRADLKKADMTRDALENRRGEIEDLLENLRSRLTQLQLQHASVEAVKTQKDAIRSKREEQLKLLKDLLAIQQKRLGLLNRIREASPPVESTPTVTKTPSDVLSQKPPSSTQTAKVEDFGKKTEVFPDAPDKKPETTIAMFQQELAKLKGDQRKLQEAMEYNVGKKTEAESNLKAAKAAGDTKKIAFYQRELDGWVAREKLTSKKLDEARTKVVTLKKKFEGFVASQNRNDYLMPGQKLELIVAEDKSFNGDYTIRSGGYIILPRVGRVRVAGKTREDAELAVKNLLESTQLRVATVLLEPARIDDPDEETKALQREFLRAKIRSLRGEEGDIGQDVLYLTGAFKKTGPWPIPKNFQPTLLTTLIRSGGVTEEADLSSVRVLRMINGRAVTETVDLKGLMEGRPGIMDVKLNANDILIVPEAAKKQLQTVFITGNVKSPGPLKLVFDKKVTAYTAILKSGGFARFANLKKVFILRDDGSGKKARIPVDMKEVKLGKAEDPELKPNDIIVVPESFWGTGN